MQITETKVKVSALCKRYRDDGDGGVYDEEEFRTPLFIDFCIVFLLFFNLKKYLRIDKETYINE